MTLRLVDSLRFCLDTENKEVYEFLHFLDTYSNVSAENKSLEIQRQYTVRWCILSQFLYENRHLNFKIPTEPPLKFIVHYTDSNQKYSTSVHWYQSFYQVDLLSKQLLQAITLKTGSPALGNKVKTLGESYNEGRNARMASVHKTRFRCVSIVTSLFTILLIQLV